MHGRQTVTWDGVDGAATMTAVFDRGYIRLFYDEDPELAKDAIAAVW